MGGEPCRCWRGLSAYVTSRQKSSRGYLTLPTFIHVVDDDPSFRAAIGRLLRKVGYEVTTYDSARQMLEKLPDENRPGCILLDVRIPGLTGPELQDRLAERGFTLPIIFLTGHGDIPTTVQTMKAGAEDFLTKPVPKEKLVAAIERAVARHQTARATRPAQRVTRPCSNSHAARTRSVRACRRGKDEQTDRTRIRHNRTHYKSTPPQSDGENAGSIAR